MFLSVLLNMITLCSLMVVGYVIRKLNIISENATKEFSNLLIYLTVPCLVIMAMQRPFSKELLLDCGLTVVISVIIHFVFYYLGVFLSRFLPFKSSEKQVFIFVMTFTNMAFMGFPVITGIFGEESLFYGAISNAVFNILVYTLGVKIMKKNDDTASSDKLGFKSFFSPAVIAAVVGMVLFIFSIELPAIVGKTLSLIGNMTTPLSMIVIGCLLTKSKFRSLFSDYRLYIVSVIRLVISPIIVLIILKPLLSNGMLLGVLTVFAGMPAASMAAILANKYGADEVFASKTVFITTVLSVFTIPLISLIVL